jgi:acyl-CoA thioesterase
MHVLHDLMRREIAPQAGRQVVVSIVWRISPISDLSAVISELRGRQGREIACSDPRDLDATRIALAESRSAASSPGGWLWRTERPWSTASIATMTDTHPFDQATRLEPVADGRWRGHTHTAYANMVGPFGGVTAAAMLGAVMRHADRQGEPIALTVNFAGPVAEGEFVVDAQVARTNRSTQHWTVQMRQGDAVVATATAVLATRRETWSAVEAGFPAAPAAATLARTPPIEQVRWTAAYDMRFVKGPLQFSGPPAADQDATSLLWVRDEPPRALDFTALAALCDTFFPRIFVKRATWVPIGTVSFTVYFHADAATLAAIGTTHLLAHARAHQFRNGFFDQSGELWGAGGELLAVTHQIVYYRE